MEKYHDACLGSDAIVYHPGLTIGYFMAEKQQILSITSCSNHIFSRPRDWNQHIHQHGYWLTEEPATYQPSSKLDDFLANGDKPVYVGFGSMTDKDNTERMARIIIEALALAGKRGILGGMAELTNLPNTIISIESVPHTWLFPRMAAVCHHGGAGTAAAEFQAGVPSIIVPFALDQFAWAQRSYELGIGSKPLPAKKLNAKRLSEAILFSTQAEIILNAKAIGQKIAAENGACDCALITMQTMETSLTGKIDCQS